MTANDCSSWLLYVLRFQLIPDIGRALQSPNFGRFSNPLLRRSIHILSDDPAADPAAKPGAAPEMNPAADSTADAAVDPAAGPG